MSDESQEIVYFDVDHCFILRSNARHRASKDSPDGSARLAHVGAPFETPSGRLRARGKRLLRTRAKLQ